MTTKMLLYFRAELIIHPVQVSNMWCIHSNIVKFIIIVALSFCAEPVLRSAQYYYLFYNIHPYWGFAHAACTHYTMFIFELSSLVCLSVLCVVASYIKPNPCVCVCVVSRPLGITCRPSHRRHILHLPWYANRIIQAMVAQHVEEFGRRSRGAHNAEHCQGGVPDDQQTAQLKPVYGG